EDYKKLIWELNPFVDGFTDESGIFHFSTYYTDTQNLLDTLMLLYGLEDNKRMHEPEIYYQPILQSNLKGAIVYDPNFISYTGDLRSNLLIQRWFKDNHVQINYQMVVLGNRFIALGDQPLLRAASIFDFCNILASIDTIYCFTTGTATLAAALKVKTFVFYGKGHEKGYRHSLQNKYIYLGTDYRFIDQVKKGLPELPHKRFIRYTETLGLSPYSAGVLIADRALSNAFERAIHLVKNPIALCNWLTVEFVGRLNEDKVHFMDANIPIENVAYLVSMIENGVITGKIAKEIKEQMCLTKKHPQEIFDQNPDYKPLSDTKEIEAIIHEVLKENRHSVADYKNGIQKAFNALVGQVMKKTKGKANPEIVNSLLVSSIAKED
ncbi:hypothetical protein EB008_04520, partial [bacterium]|nr:hypothetical protein [bacterium]